MQGQDKIIFVKVYVFSQFADGKLEINKNLIILLVWRESRSKRLTISDLKHTQLALWLCTYLYAALVYPAIDKELPGIW